MTVATARVVSYLSLARTVGASGVPRHSREVVGRMLEDQRLEACLLVHADEARRHLPELPPPWQRAERRELPLSGRLARGLWAVAGAPKVERIVGACDWVYLPADGYVATSARLAVTIHDVYTQEPPAPGEGRLTALATRMRLRRIYQRVAAGAARVLVVSTFTADRVVSLLGVDSRRIHVVYNGVDPAFFSPQGERWPALQQALGLTSGRYVVHVGGLRPKKNGAVILRAWERFRARNPDVRLVLVGAGETGEAAARRAAGVVTARHLSDVDLSVLLANAACLFFPSRYEGFGIPVVEAMAAGTLVVASDIPPLREVGGETTFFGHPDDAAGFAPLLERCLSDDGERSDRVERGRARARAFTWDACYERVLGGLGLA